MSAVIRLLIRNHTFSSCTAPHLEGRSEEEVLFAVVMSVAARYVIVKERVCARSLASRVVSSIVMTASNMSRSLDEGRRRNCGI